MKNIIVTGASGFIGSNFVNTAQDKGYNITVISRKDVSQLSNIFSKKVNFIHKDLLNIEQKMLENCNTLVHLASSGVSPKKVDINEMLMSNVIGTYHLIECAAKAKVKRIIVAGTCNEYGNIALTDQPIKVDTQLNPESFYAASKAASYAICLAQCRKHKIKMFYGRIASVYGDGQFENNFWPLLKKAALKGDDFHMTSGEQIRDFIHVDLVVNKLLKACNRKDLLPGKLFVQNIGSGHPRTLIDFATAQWKLFKAKGSLIPGSIPSRINEPKQINLDLAEKFF